MGSDRSGGFLEYFTITVIRSPQNPILMFKAPTLATNEIVVWNRPELISQVFRLLSRTEKHTGKRTSVAPRTHALCLTLHA